jgi:hypothetical protein
MSWIFSREATDDGTKYMRRIPILILLVIPLLASCTPPPTQAQAQATAVVAGCWPGNAATPRAVTVTPDLVVATPTSAALTTSGPGTPTATRWPTATHAPTTTPYPRCTPGPDETLVPYPTPAPARSPYPTQEPKLRQGGSDEQTTIQLPGRTYALSLAVHPTEGWPVVGIMQRFSESADPIQSFVRVYNPHAKQWGPAQQVDIGESSNGQDRNGSIVVGITGDRTVHVVWGGSDRAADGSEGGLWTSSSADYGAHWSAPQQIATDCALALDMATTAAGDIVVLASCYTRVGNGATFHADMLVRHPNGTWEPPAQLAAPATFGAVVIAGDGATTTAYALTIAHPSQGDPRQLYLLAKRLAVPGEWNIQTRAFAVDGIDSSELGDFGINVRAMTFARSVGGTSQRGIVFMFSGRNRASAYGLSSLDGGASWGAVEPIAFRAHEPETSGYTIGWAAPAYDPAADRLLALWTCCADASGATVEATHYASWSVPGSGVWTPELRTGVDAPRVPIVLGSRSAASSVTAQAKNARVVWVGWVEQGNQIHVRTLNLNQIVPVGAYPLPTLRPAPTIGVAP